VPRYLARTSMTLTVDASGRGSRTPRWLEALGWQAGRFDREVNVMYASRLYRPGPEIERLADHAPPPGQGRCGRTAPRHRARGRNVDCSQALLLNAARVPAPSRPGIQWLALRLLQVQVDAGPRPPGQLAAAAMPASQARGAAGDMAGVRACAIVYGDRNSSSNKLEGIFEF
jgi:hypothetical protein